MQNSPFINEITDSELKALGITAYGCIQTADIKFSQEVYDLNEMDQRRLRTTTWACPPAIGTFEECRARCLAYEHAFVFSAAYKLEDSYDFEGMMDGHRKFKKVCDALYDLMKQPCMLLSNDGCLRCGDKACTYPDAPCRFPEKLFASVEGYGIVVPELAKSAGVPYMLGEDHVCYFGIVCYN